MTIISKLVAAGAAIAAIPVIGAGVWLWLQWEQLSMPVQSALRTLIFAIPIATAAAGAYVGVMAVYNRLARLEIVKADKAIDMIVAQVQRFPDGLQSLSFHD